MSDLLSNIVTSGLCIGCGLCESVAGSERVRVAMTPEGVERPVVQIPLPMATEQTVRTVCPGVQMHGFARTCCR